MKTDQLQSLTIAGAASLIATGQLSPLELTEACLQRIQQLEPKLNAFITVTADEALAAAREAEGAIASGNYKGPLHGIPIAHKDLLYTKGVRTTAGSKILADFIPADDATVVSRLKEAGAISLGKLNMHEVALGGTSINPHYGPVRNPWDTSRIPGGSSGGSGAAVIAGQCLGALGSDTAGSIRIPASLCGIVGLKPTYGRVSRYGVVPLSWALDHVGPLCRTAEDTALMLQVLAGPDPKDPSASEAPVPDYRAGLAGGLKGLRVAVPKEYFFENLDPEVEEAVQRAIEVLAELSGEVTEVSLPYLHGAIENFMAISRPEALSYHLPWLRERPDDYGDDVRFLLEGGALYPGVHYVQAQRLRATLIQEWQAIFRDIDLVVTPTTPIVATKIEETNYLANFSLIRCTCPFNLSGQPAISLPCGFTKDGLPIGLQLVGRWWEETTVLRAAQAYQQATEWHKRRPPL